MTAATTSELPAPEASKRREHVPLGILYMVGATIVFSASSACSKWLVATYPAGEVLFTRSVVSLIACAAVVLPTTARHRPPRMQKRRITCQPARQSRHLAEIENARGPGHSQPPSAW